MSMASYVHGTVMSMAQLWLSMGTAYPKYAQDQYLNG